MKKILAILAIVGMLSGCASMNLPDNATTAEQKAAACLDAQTALAAADAALAAVPAGDATEYIKYWTVFRAGAQIGVTAYCGVPK